MSQKCNLKIFTCAHTHSENLNTERISNAVWLPNSKIPNPNWAIAICSSTFGRFNLVDSIHVGSILNSEIIWGWDCVLLAYPDWPNLAISSGKHPLPRLVILVPLQFTIPSPNWSFGVPFFALSRGQSYKTMYLHLRTNFQTWTKV